MKTILTLVWLVMVLALADTCLAEIPSMINFQGVLEDNTGVPHAEERDYEMAFRIYGDENASIDDHLWTEQYTVTVKEDVFDVQLGSGDLENPENSIDLPFDKPYWLGVTVVPEGSDPYDENAAELSPRLPLLTSPYAFRAEIADTAESVDENAITSAGILDGEIKAADLANNSIIPSKIPDGSIAVQKLDFVPDPVNETPLAGDDISVDDRTVSLKDEIAVKSISAADGSGLKLYDDGSNLGIFIEDGGKVGIGTSSPDLKLHVAGGDIRLEKSATNADVQMSFKRSDAAADPNMYLTYWGQQDVNTLALTCGTGAGLHVTTGGNVVVSNFAASNFPGSGKFVVMDGNVGIGTASPEAKLHLYGSGVDSGAGEIKLQNAAGDAPAYGLTAGLRNITNSGFGIYDYTNSLYRLVIKQSNGNVGIGTANPAEKLTVAGIIESTSGGIKFPDGTVQTAAGGQRIAVLTGTAAHGETIPLPSGYTQDQCKWIVSRREQSRGVGYSDSWRLYCYTDANRKVYKRTAISGSADSYGTVNYMIIGIK